MIDPRSNVVDREIAKKESSCYSILDLDLGSITSRCSRARRKLSLTLTLLPMPGFIA